MADLPNLTDPAVGRAAAAVPGGVCDACLGRCFARLEPGQENRARGQTLRSTFPLAPAATICPLCEGVADRIGLYVAACLAAAGGYEFGTFLVGSKFFKEITDRERELWTRLMEADGGDLAGRLPEPQGGAPPWPAGEWLKNEVNRSVGRQLESDLAARADLAAPELVFSVDTRVDAASVEPRAVCIRGRYRKLVRDIPQTRWPCRSCGGLGCRACDFGGKRYPTSVEEEIAHVAAPLFDAEAFAFHGMGREDVDARMLGAGRPFVLELKRPRRRQADLGPVADRVRQASAGRVEVEALEFTDGKEAARFKEADPAKTYRATCRAENAIDQDKLLKAIRSLEGSLLDQRTPQRVSHRRADKVRRRSVRALRLLRHAGDRFDLEIEADSGTYIKEFVSGDDGRTTPSVTERLGTPVRVEELDVVAIHWES